MIHARAEISFRIKRFAAYFLQIYVCVLIANLARGTSWAQILFDSVLWAGLATALFIVVREHVPKLGKNQSVRRML